MCIKLCLYYCFTQTYKVATVDQNYLKGLQRLEDLNPMNGHSKNLSVNLTKKSIYNLND